MQTINHLPVISRIEYVERVRAMPILRRMTYALWMSLMTCVALCLAISAAVLIAAVGFSLLLGNPLTLTSTMVLALPVICSFLVAMAFGERIIPESVVSGATFPNTLRRVFRSAVITGLASGVIFGLAWGFVVRMHGFYAQWLAPEANINEMALIQQIIVSCLVMAAAIAPTFALFRSITGAIGQIILFRALTPGKPTPQLG